jgi:hypothetical protein
MVAGVMYGGFGRTGAIHAVMRGPLGGSGMRGWILALVSWIIVEFTLRAYGITYSLLERPFNPLYFAIKVGGWLAVNMILDLLWKRIRQKQNV